MANGHHTLRHVLTLSRIIEIMLLNISLHLWLMHDGIWPHYLIAVWIFLKNVFPDR